MLRPWQIRRMITNLLSYYMQGANYLSSMQNQSLQTSKGNATQTHTTGSDDLLSVLIPIAVKTAINAAQA